jgi:hypothetical protein
MSASRPAGLPIRKEFAVPLVPAFAALVAVVLTVLAGTGQATEVPVSFSNGNGLKATCLHFEPPIYFCRYWLPDGTSYRDDNARETIQPWKCGRQQNATERCTEADLEAAATRVAGRPVPTAGQALSTPGNATPIVVSAKDVNDFATAIRAPAPPTTAIDERETLRRELTAAREQLANLNRDTEPTVNRLQGEIGGQKEEIRRLKEENEKLKNRPPHVGGGDQRSFSTIESIAAASASVGLFTFLGVYFGGTFKRRPGRGPGNVKIRLLTSPGSASADNLAALRAELREQIEGVKKAKEEINGQYQAIVQNRSKEATELHAQIRAVEDRLGIAIADIQGAVDRLLDRRTDRHRQLPPPVPREPPPAPVDAGGAYRRLAGAIGTLVAAIDEHDHFGPVGLALSLGGVHKSLVDEKDALRTCNDDLARHLNAAAGQPVPTWLNGSFRCHHILQGGLRDDPDLDTLRRAFAGFIAVVREEAGKVGLTFSSVDTPVAIPSGARFKESSDTISYLPDLKGYWEKVVAAANERAEGETVIVALGKVGVNFEGRETYPQYVKYNQRGL